jgi:hypothetical protein
MILRSLANALADHEQHLKSVKRCRAARRNFALSLAAAATLSACATLRTASRDSDCQVSSAVALVPFAPARALALVGKYNFIVVADSGPRAGHSAHGNISLAPNDTLHRYYIDALGQGWRRRGDRPLIGWAELRGDVGLMTGGTLIGSRDPAQPGVAFGLDSLRGGLRFMLGYEYGMNDGGYNEFTVTSAADDGFAGHWQSSLGPTNYRATGLFCARRVPAL